MSINFNKFIPNIVFILFVCLFCPQPSEAAANLIKTSHSATIYYLGADNLRHPFPNQQTYQSWFADNFNQVSVVTEEVMQTLSLGKNITLKPGKFLVKVPTAPEVYAVEPGGTLRHIQTVAVAEKIYGRNWQSRLIDLPEVFFNDYVIGQPIETENQLPDGLIYKSDGKSNYYYKTRGHLRPFNSWADVLANGYNQNDVVVGKTSFYLHGREIQGYDALLNNPLVENNLARYDCENKKLTAAFVFIYNSKYTPDEIQKIQAIKDSLSEYFSWATDNLANLTLADEIFLIKKENYHIYQEKLDNSQIAFDFYDSHPDNYDFLFVFDNFSDSGQILAKHTMVTNQIAGINKILLKAEVQYGSLGKLKGIINVYNLKNHLFSADYEKTTTLNRLVHETLHQWSSSMVFLNEEINDDFSLLDKGLVHWSNYVNFVSPLGGLGWHDNNNGTFTQIFSDYKIKLSNLDLYAMGLLPLRGVGEIFYLQPEKDIITATIVAQKNIVSPERLTMTMGEWQCKK